MLKTFILIMSMILFVYFPSSAKTDSLSIFSNNKEQSYSRIIYSNESYKFSSKHLIAPGILVTYGVVKLNNGLMNRFDNRVKDVLCYKKNKITIDNYTQFAPAVGVFGLNFFGVKGRHNYLDLTVIYGSTVLLTTIAIQGLKRITAIKRPDGSSSNSFPSGHTATAFAAAEFLRIEYSNHSPWIGIAGYTLATATGLGRIYNNRHWLSDVVAGAGIGILCTKVVYWLYPSSNFTNYELEKKKRYTTAFYPYFNSREAGLSFSMKF